MLDRYAMIVIDASDFNNLSSMMILSLYFEKYRKCRFCENFKYSADFSVPNRYKDFNWKSFQTEKV